MKAEAALLSRRLAQSVREDIYFVTDHRTYMVFFIRISAKICVEFLDLLRLSIR